MISVTTRANISAARREERKLGIDGSRADVLARCHVTNPEGRVELTVRCTERGCVLEFAVAELELSAPGKVALECEELSLRTQRTLELSTEGDWVSRVGGSSVTQVEGRAEVRAEEVELVATRGDAVMRANDHVKLVGEKVMLNSEHEGQNRAELEAFWKLFGM